ncbi:CHAT domain-containing protein [Mycena sp. CBHHK59/15]|nr:CHAT domain-containing protein [Mycena sp. CBHHK59/15]
MSVVIQPDAPGCSPLPGTKEELDKITQHVSRTWLTALLCPTGQQVLDQLPKSSVAHFACHGVQDASEPLNSGLMLSDGRLKVLEIMKKDDRDMDSRERGMSLAFLSACETAKGDRATPDEVMHLAASLMFAGFHSVVATMWTMQDFDGPKVADGFYEHLFKEIKISSPKLCPNFDPSPRMSDPGPGDNSMLYKPGLECDHSRHPDVYERREDERDNVDFEICGGEQMKVGHHGKADADLREVAEEASYK